MKSAMICGTTQMLKLSVDNWDTVVNYIYILSNDIVEDLKYGRYL